MYYIYLFFLIISCFYIINKYFFGHEYFYNYDNNIYFINKQDAIDILIGNKDNYYETFSTIDYNVRNINTIEDYYECIEKSVCNFTNNEKKQLIKAIQTSNAFFEKINYSWLNGKKMNSIPWKIICVEGKLYENGLPHTRYDCIIISKEDIENLSFKTLTKNMIHEKVHVYQKIYKNDFYEFLKKYNFTLIKEKTFEDNIRANPDIDNYIYMDNKNIVYKATYIDNASSIEDINYPYHSQSFEHPCEKMAIEIENLF